MIAAVLLTTLAFTAVHPLHGWQTSIAFFFGAIGMSIAALATRSLAMPIAMHFAWNLTIPTIAGPVGDTWSSMAILRLSVGSATVPIGVYVFLILPLATETATLTLLLLHLRRRNDGLRVDPAYLEPEILPQSERGCPA